MSRSVVAVGCEFSFSIDVLASKHLELTSSPEPVESFAKTQAELLSASREILKVFLEEHRTYHRKFVNPCYMYPCIYKEGNIVFAHCSACSGV